MSYICRSAHAYEGLCVGLEDSFWEPVLSVHHLWDPVIDFRLPDFLPSTLFC